MRSEQQVEAALKSYEDVDSWKTIIFLYNAALKEVGTKLDLVVKSDCVTVYTMCDQKRISLFQIAFGDGA